LGICARQMKRLRRKMRERGVGGLAHDNQGKRSWNKTASEKMKKVIKLAGDLYLGLNDTYLAEKLREKEQLKSSRSTIRHRNFPFYCPPDRRIRHSGIIRPPQEPIENLVEHGTDR
jgi:hypothetical protein